MWLLSNWTVTINLIIRKELNIMSKITELKPLIPSVSALVATSALIMSPLNAAEQNPFQLTELSSGYMVADKEGKCGEGKCGEGKCGKGKKMKMMDTDGDGAISKQEFMAHAEKKFAKKDKNGDGVISRDEMKRKKMHKEGKCGEGKCGEKK